MKKRKFMYMIFMFSSLCSCSMILLPYCPLASFAKSTVTRTSGPAGREPRLNQNGKQTFCKTENLVLFGSSWAIIEYQHELHLDIASASVPFDPANMRSKKGGYGKL